LILAHQTRRQYQREMLWRPASCVNILLLLLNRWAD
jgi:hypothetical protein